MPSHRHAILAAAVAVGLALAGPRAAIAQTVPESREQAEEMAREAMEQLMHALEMFIQSIPQYEMPEVNEHGDIIIRRKRWPERAPDQTPSEPEVDSTKT